TRKAELSYQESLAPPPPLSPPPPEKSLPPESLEEDDESDEDQLLPPDDEPTSTPFTITDLQPPRRALRNTMKITKPNVPKMTPKKQMKTIHAAASPLCTRVSATVFPLPL